MESDDWWALIERARALAGDRAPDRDPPDDPLPAALVEVLAGLAPAEIVDFRVRADGVAGSAYRRPLWNAAYLIEGGCGDDGFMDFRDGLILLGRETFTRAVADPDSLAALPVVVRMSHDEGGWVGFESLDHLVTQAYRRAVGESESLRTAVAAALRAATAATGVTGVTRSREPAGRGWDPEDDRAARRHLPRLAALFLDRTDRGPAADPAGAEGQPVRR
ncbi:DUF4240 domain-containing protein [Kitasatospora sp. MBT63]|uniref:DUF4240 domain-containing protein n=1 Tax=Kitasatospora sp. MBT63 TaxID=1444768 RepID=UPI0007C821AD|nr:DUF4240 domain-containing protein [Kitasatospora sp. MBT63]